MLKAKGVFQGRECLMLGLSFGNLRKFMAEPLDTFITIDGKQFGLDHDIIIFSGRTEKEMFDFVIASK